MADQLTEMRRERERLESRVKELEAYEVLAADFETWAWANSAMTKPNQEYDRGFDAGHNRARETFLRKLAQAKAGELIDIRLEGD